MYTINKNEPLTTKELQKILPNFTTKERPMLQRYWNYYQGKQDIMKRVSRDESRKVNKIVCNYCYDCTEDYLGYIAGIPIKYSNDEFTDIIDILLYNDVHCEDVEYLRQALIFGRAYEINYLDEEGKQRFKTLDSRECVAVYSNDLNNELLYAIRFYKEEPLDTDTESYIVEVYGPNTIDRYRSTSGFISFQYIETVPHYYGMCPITEFSLNTDQSSIFKQIMGLNDCYNSLLSDEVDDFDAFADAYLVLTGMTADENDLKTMKEQRCILLDEGCTADYLTKNISDTQITNMLQNINDQIHTKGKFPDFNDEKFMAQSGIAMRFKIIGFENQAASIEAQMRKALQRRIELINSIMNKTDEVWRDVDITFTRNLPQNLSDNVNVVTQLQGVVSNETLYSLLPFIKNPEEELAKVEAEKQKNIAMYGFQDDIEEEDDEK